MSCFIIYVSRLQYCTRASILLHPLPYPTEGVDLGINIQHKSWDPSKASEEWVVIPVCKREMSEEETNNNGGSSPMHRLC